MASSGKEKRKMQVVEYIGNPENAFPTRTEIALDVLKYTEKTSYYKLFTTKEMAELEEEGLQLRKENSKRERAVVYESLLREAKKGNVQACKEYLDRTEGKVIDKKEITGKDGKDLVPTLNVSLTGN